MLYKDILSVEVNYGHDGGGNIMIGETVLSAPNRDCAKVYHDITVLLARYIRLRSGAEATIEEGRKLLNCLVKSF